MPEYGQEFVEALVRLMNAKIPQPNFDLLIGLKVIPMKTLPKRPYMNVSCQTCNETKVIEFGADLQKNVKLMDAKLTGHEIGFVDSTGKECFKEFMFVGRCEKCKTRFVAASLEVLKSLAFFAVFQTWPREM